MQGHHNCSTELRVATLPVQKPFWYSLFPHERPKRGFSLSLHVQFGKVQLKRRQTTDTSERTIYKQKQKWNVGQEAKLQFQTALGNQEAKLLLHEIHLHLVVL